MKRLRRMACWWRNKRTITLNTADLDALRTGTHSLQRNGRWIYWD
jgi:hypothetical protein